MKALARYALILLAATLAAASLVPLIPTEWWAVRLLDFPRLPLAAALAAVGIGLLFFLRGAPRSTAPVLAIVVCALVVDVWVLWPYLPTHGLRVDACPAGRRLSVLVANVQLGNRNAKPLGRGRRADRARPVPRDGD